MPLVLTPVSSFRSRAESVQKPSRYIRSKRPQDINAVCLAPLETIDCSMTMSLYRLTCRTRSLPVRDGHLPGSLTRKRTPSSASLLITVSQGALGIQGFLGKDVQLPMEDFPDAESNKILATAMRNLEIELAVYYSPAFIGSLTEFVECLHIGKDKSTFIRP